MESNNRFSLDTLAEVIRRRRTTKVLAEVDQPLVYTAEQLREYDDVVLDCLTQSGWAPFHYDRKLDCLAEPWRIHWLDYASCRNLAQQVKTLIPDLKTGSKLPGLLSACGCVAIFNWVPQTDVENSKIRRINEEHLAATAAAIQNFLLLLTAAEIENYWSSGGLWEQYVFPSLGIDIGQRNAGIVFVHYPSNGEGLSKVSGKQRQQRSKTQAWLRKVAFS